jgi:hypothetical protein
MDMSDPAIGVMLTAYRRTHLLKRQLEAIRAQTVKPAKIMLWHNQWDGMSYKEDVTHPDHAPSDILALPHIVSSENLGVWPRFMLSPMLGTDYIAVFDDDTIPGPRWFENCLRTMEELKRQGIQGALLGGVGVSFVDGVRENRAYFGWKHPADVALQVDIVGHAWFYRPTLLENFRGAAYCAQHPTCGEDYSLSRAAQDLGWPTVCPPHPEHDQSWWSSIGGMENGSDDHALWRDPAEAHKKAEFHDWMKFQGMKFTAAKMVNGGVDINAWEMPHITAPAKPCPTCGRPMEAA